LYGLRRRPPGAHYTSLSLSPVHVRIDKKEKKKVAKQFGHTQSEVPTGGRNYYKKKKEQNTKRNGRVFGCSALGARNFPSAIG
jgi:hypothetical protein